MPHRVRSVFLLQKHGGIAAFGFFEMLFENLLHAGNCHMLMRPAGKDVAVGTLVNATPNQITPERIRAGTRKEDSPLLLPFPGKDKSGTVFLKENVAHFQVANFLSAGAARVHQRKEHGVPATRIGGFVRNTKQDGHFLSGEKDSRRGDCFLGGNPPQAVQKHKGGVRIAILRVRGEGRKGYQTDIAGGCGAFAF